VVTSKPLRSLFDGMQHEQRIRRVPNFDKRVLLENRSALSWHPAGSIMQHACCKQAAASGMPYCERRWRGSVASPPLRKTMRSAEHAVRAIQAVLPDEPPHCGAIT
jgi:hypothetical protein